MKKLIAIAVIVFSIVMSQLGKEEGVYWGITLLHIFVVWCIVKNIKNTSLKALVFLTLMNTMLITSSTMNAAIQEIPTTAKATLSQVSELYQKIAETCRDVAIRIEGKNWEDFNKSQAIRRLVFVLTISFPFSILINEGRGMVTNKEKK